MRSGNLPRGELFPPELDVLWSNRLVRRVVGLASAVRRLGRKHPVLLDSLLALLVLANSLVDLLVPDGRHDPDARPDISVLLLVSMAGQTLPLIWRRRAPSVVLAAVLLSCLLQWSQGGEFRSGVGSLMIALYSMARYDWIKRLPWAALGTVVALTVAAFCFQPFDQQSLTILFFLCSSATAAIAVALVVRVREAQLSALADRATQLEVERAQREQLAVFAERTRVSREMHDIVGHNLAVIIGLADGAAAAPDADRSAQILRIIAGTGRQALSELRRTLGALRERPDQQEDTVALSPQPGTADLGGLLERTQAAGPRISYRTAGRHDAMTPGVQLAVYRIVQEALTNSLKHAGPETSVQVVLRVTDRAVDVSVRDSGPPQGSPKPEPTGHTGHTGQMGQGLVGISERAALAGGSAEAGPTDSGGWVVHAVLPLLPPPAVGENRP
ncbi:histidine kinase [Streptomyces sp. NPDC093544]|uniref:sensor histidine kinase n=1 Tax=Streptomyces sp. NPDC093544 TaxID=3155200 RepID=UPI0034181522